MPFVLQRHVPTNQKVECRGTSCASFDKVVDVPVIMQRHVPAVKPSLTGYDLFLGWRRRGYGGRAEGEEKS